MYGVALLLWEIVYPGYRELPQALIERKPPMKFYE
jgi:hypothetical protein